MIMSQLENINPHVYTKVGSRPIASDDYNDDIEDPFDAREIFDLIRHIKDPEHPLTLEELNVVEIDKCVADDKNGEIVVHFTPTIPHCSMASLIGLSIRLKLLRCIPSRFKVDVRISPGTHASEEAVNKQLADKERVTAALENPHLLKVVNKCIAPDPKLISDIFNWNLGS